MKEMKVEKLADMLKILVTITFVCNLLALVMVPGMARMKGVQELLEGIAYYKEQGNYGEELILRGGGAIFLRLVGYCLASWSEVWIFGDSYSQVLTVFLLFCGCCTAVILWQARRVLDTVLAGETFSMTNAANMKRAAVCCLLISFAALVRLLWGFAHYQSIRPLLTYNALFVPVFAMGFLLCMVMSALFRQAAEIKAENDLTI